MPSKPSARCHCASLKHKSQCPHVGVRWMSKDGKTGWMCHKHSASAARLGWKPVKENESRMRMGTTYPPGAANAPKPLLYKGWLIERTREGYWVGYADGKRFNAESVTAHTLENLKREIDNYEFIEKGKRNPPGIRPVEGAYYRYQPVGMDLADPKVGPGQPPIGAGAIVRVVGGVGGRWGHGCTKGTLKFVWITDGNTQQSVWPKSLVPLTAEDRRLLIHPSEIAGNPPGKNLMGKTRKLDQPYEVWKSRDGQWEWRVLKKWQSDDRKPYARWFCAVKSPFTHGGWEMGDTYAAEVMKQATKVSTILDAALGDPKHFIVERVGPHQPHPASAFSYKVEVLTGEAEWVSNALRFTTQIEAGQYGNDLMSRWMAVQEVRVTQTSDAPTHTFMDGVLKELHTNPRTVPTPVEVSKRAVVLASIDPGIHLYLVQHGRQHFEEWRWAEDDGDLIQLHGFTRIEFAIEGLRKYQPTARFIHLTTPFADRMRMEEGHTVEENPPAGTFTVLGKTFTVPGAEAESNPPERPWIEREKP